MTLWNGHVMNYQFDKEHISQHIVKYGVTLRPALTLRQDKTRLQDYCNWLTEQFPEVFETLLAGPDQLRVQKRFALANNNHVQVPTFVLTAGGPLFTLPWRMYLNEPQDFDICDRDRIFRKVLEQLRNRFVDRAVPRVGVIHELVFDTGQIDSVQIIASTLKNDLWRQKAVNLQLRLEVPAQDKNVNLDIRPTRLQPIRKQGQNAPARNLAFGIIVNVDINNRQVKNNLSATEVRDIVAFANDYVPEELLKFLNKEY